MIIRIFNGSPRGESGNTEALLKHFVAGIGSVKEEVDIRICYLDQLNERALHFEEYRKAEVAIIAMPLYMYSMPWLVKEFIEGLWPAKGKKLGFIVQSGLIETKHSFYLEKYLEKLADKLGTIFLGTIVKGGVDKIVSKPKFLTRKLFRAFYKLGVSFGGQFTFDRSMIRKLKKPYDLGLLGVMISRLMPIRMPFNFNNTGHGSENDDENDDEKPSFP